MQHFPAPPRLVVLRPSTLLALVVGLAFCAAIRPASAQIGSGGINMPQTSNPSSLIGPPAGLKPVPMKQPNNTPPDALPGAVSHSDRVAPSQGAPIADPTQALFDAINRGDIASARDAIDRGADLDGESVLGMTPLDTSVDLGRNDITFLLLSLRNGDSRSAGRGAVQTTQGGPAAKAGSTHVPASGKAQIAGQAKAAGQTSTAGQTKAAARAPATPPAKQAAQVAPAAPVAPRLFAGDGGTPNPGVGFLGFDTKH
jgi:hypothetical protein